MYVYFFSSQSHLQKPVEKKTPQAHIWLSVPFFSRVASDEEDVEIDALIGLDDEKDVEDEGEEMDEEKGRLSTRVVLPPTDEENARCKVCFKTFEEKEFFRICSVCIRRVCDDCSASYGKKENDCEVSTLK